MVNIGLNMQKLGMPDEWIQNNLLGITNTKELKRQYVQQQAEASLLQYKLQQKVDQVQKQDQQREQLKDQQLQQAIAAAQQAAGQGSGQPTGSSPLQQEPSGTVPNGQGGLTPGQEIDMQMLNNAYTGQPAAAAEPGMPGAGPEVMPGMEMGGGLPGAMSGMIPGQGLAGTPDETGMMR